MAAQGGGGPVVDGTIVPRHPFDPDAPAISANVPMMIGSCLEDSGYQSTEFDVDEAGVQAWIESQVAGSRGAAAPGRLSQALSRTRSLSSSAA